MLYIACDWSVFASCSGVMDGQLRNASRGFFITGQVQPPRKNKHTLGGPSIKETAPFNCPCELFEEPELTTTDAAHTPKASLLLLPAQLSCVYRIKAFLSCALTALRHSESANRFSFYVTTGTFNINIHLSGELLH